MFLKAALTCARRPRASKRKTSIIYRSQIHMMQISKELGGLRTSVMLVPSCKMWLGADTRPQMAQADRNGMLTLLRPLKM